MTTLVPTLLVTPSGLYTRNLNYRVDYQKNKSNPLAAKCDLVYMQMEDGGLYTQDQLDAMWHAADVQYALDGLIDKGLVVQSLNDQGEIVYSAVK